MSQNKKSVAIEISITKIIKSFFKNIKCNVITYSLDHVITNNNNNSMQYNHDYVCKIIFNDEILNINMNKIISIDAEINSSNYFAINEEIQLEINKQNGLALDELSKQYVKKNLNTKYDSETFIEMLEKIFLYYYETINI